MGEQQKILKVSTLEELKQEIEECKNNKHKSLKITGNNKCLSTLTSGLLTDLFVQILDLSSNSINKLEDSIFDGTMVYTLKLDNNSLTDIHRNAFRGLKVQTECHMSKNKIQNCAGLFMSFRNLTKLHLDNNHITELPNDGFQGLENLQELYLQGNKISKLMEGSFNGLGKLKTLSLGENQLEEVDPCCLRSTRSLEFLLLQGNKLKQIEPETFKYVYKLSFLNLAQNNFMVVPSNSIYGSICNLKHLNFDGNKIEKLPRRSFASEGIPMALQTLSLRGNPIECIKKDTFEGIEKLNCLILSSCKINRIEKGAFNGLNYVSDLILDDNRIESIEILKNLPPCRLVRMAGNKLDGKDLPLNEFGLKQIEMISFGRCSYHRVNGTWKYVNRPIP